MSLGTVYGTAVSVSEDPSVEELRNAKKQVIDELCQLIRDVAERNDDFFIIKSYSDKATVGSKIILPTVAQEVDY